MSLENKGGMISTGEKTTDSSTRALWQYNQQSSSSKSRETGEGNEFGLKKYLCSYFGLLNVP
jgi:hypothetical protein